MPNSTKKKNPTPSVKSNTPLDRRELLLSTLSAPVAAALAACGGDDEAERPKPPNILFAFSDDQSWLHTGAAGDPNVETPAFDRVAREGVLFRNSFTAAPSCTPSRSAVLTGQHIWRLEEGGLLFGTLPEKFPVFPLLLEQAGYHIGYTGKGWGPGDWRAGGRERYPLGKAYNQHPFQLARQGIRPTDYAANFGEFLTERQGRPFFFWFGSTEPHRPYAPGAGLNDGKKLEDVSVPPFLPDTEQIRSDILDYYMEIEWFDSHLGRMIELLEQAGELENTIIVVSSDNGMPFPRAKTTLYDWGTHMPLAIRWGERIPGGRVIDDFVSHTDFAPTFLEAAGVTVPEDMTGRSLMPLLLSEEQGQVDPERDKAVTAIERHTWCRPDGALYPSRAIRTGEFLYIRNYHPDRWPAGDPDFDSPHQGFYGDIDDSPTKAFMMEESNREEYEREFELCFGKRPAEELYNVSEDPGQINNLADDEDYAATKRGLSADLDLILGETGDPRAAGREPWQDYPYHYEDYAQRARESASQP